MNKNILTTIVFAAFSIVAMAQGQKNHPVPVMLGDFADPTIVRDGKDFYMTHSSFTYSPGLVIWHSRDLVNWKQIGAALPHYDGESIYAPDITKYKGRFYIYYPAGGKVFVAWTDDIRGKWSEPVWIEGVNGIDPGHIADQETGQRYLYVNNGNVYPLNEEGTKITGPGRKVYDGWKYPAEWETEGMWLESPKLFWHDGYYYLISAEGGTAGPPTSHMVVCSRAKSPVGPWEDSPYNPVVHTYSDAETWWSIGHGTAIDDKDGNWWMIYHGYPNNYHTLGRHTLLERMEWTSDGWLVASKVNNVPKQKKPQVLWQWWRGKDEIYTRTIYDKSYIFEADVNLENADSAGLKLFYNDTHSIGFLTDGQNGPKKCHIRIENRSNIVTVLVDGKPLNDMPADVSQMNHNVCGEFLSLRPSLVSYGNERAKFTHVKYTKLP